MAVTIVAGFPRSGSSLTMRMLHRGGMPVVGREPDFEDGDSMPGRITPNWVAAQEGKALKLLEPQRHRDWVFDPTSTKVIFLTRDPEQQAASQAKFAHWAAGVPFPSRQKRRALIASVATDTLATLARLKRLGVPLLHMPFEHLVLRPEASAGIMARFVDAGLDPLAMQAVVIRRSPKCLPGMLEHHQIVDLQARNAL